MKAPAQSLLRNWENHAVLPMGSSPSGLQGLYASLTLLILTRGVFAF